MEIRKLALTRASREIREKAQPVLYTLLSAVIAKAERLCCQHTGHKSLKPFLFQNTKAKKDTSVTVHRPDPRNYKV